MDINIEHELYGDTLANDRAQLSVGDIASLDQMRAALGSTIEAAGIDRQEGFDAVLIALRFMEERHGAAHMLPRDGVGDYFVVERSALPSIAAAVRSCSGRAWA